MTILKKSRGGCEINLLFAKSAARVYSSKGFMFTTKTIISGASLKRRWFKCRVSRFVLIPAINGGPDPGAVGPGGTKEKDVVMAVSKRLAEILIFAGAEVKLTRVDDSDVSLKRRVEIANGAGADVFVSIHCNAHTDRTANGTETYHYPGSAVGKELAGAIQFDLVTQLKRRDRGVRNANFAVLRETNMPAALAEIAFISNPDEEFLLQSPGFREMAARAIASGVAVHLGITLALTEDSRAVEEETIVPDWAKNSIMWAVANGLITNQAGSEDFYRLITVLHRYDMRKVDADAMP